MSGATVVHILSNGRSLCPISSTHGLPNSWPAGHVWVSKLDVIDATCTVCVLTNDGAEKMLNLMEEETQPMLEQITITVRGKHDTGKTTTASLLKMFLEENGYSKVVLRDIPPLPVEEKDRFWNRFSRNRERPVVIQVELEE